MSTHLFPETVYAGPRMSDQSPPRPAGAFAAPPLLSWLWLPSLLFVTLVLLAWFAPRDPDVVVYGGTPQGVTAALAASRQGLRVTLVVPGPQLGGVLVRGWLATLDDTDDTDDLSHRSLYGGLYARFYRGVGSTRSIDVGRAEQVFRQMLRGAGVDLRLNTALVLTGQPTGADSGAVQVGGGLVRSILVRRGPDTRRLRAGQFIDASDTADLAAAAGAGFTSGREDGGLDHRQMAATLVLRLGGVPWRKVQRALSDAYRHNHDLIGFDNQGAYGFGELSAGYRPGSARLKLRGLNIARQHDQTLLINALLIAGVDGTDQRSVAAGRSLAAAEARRVGAYLRRADPATFGQATLSGVAPELYLRETRHLVGRARLHADDALTGHSGPGSVALGGYALDGQIYDARESPFMLGYPAPYGVPYGTLLPAGLDNLLVVSQAASFDSAAAFSARVVPLQMVLGEVAGTACGLARQLHTSLAGLAQPPGTGPSEAGSSGVRPAARLDVLRTMLRAQGVRVPPEAQLSDVRSASLVTASSATTGSHTASLLRRGLLGAPYTVHGQLAADQPVLAADFLAALDHWLVARSSDPAQRAAIRQLRQWAGRRPSQPLSWAGGRAIFAWLHEDTWEFHGKAALLSREHAARLMTDMFPAPDRLAPTLSRPASDVTANHIGCPLPCRRLWPTAD